MKNSIEQIPYDAGSPGQVTRRKNAAKFERDTELSELRHILGTEGGRKFMWRLLSQCHLYDAIDNPVDEGRRRVGLWTLNEIMEAEPGAYAKMMQENRNG